MSVYSIVMGAGVIQGSGEAVLYSAPPLNTAIVRDVVVATMLGYTGTLRIYVRSGGVLSVLWGVRLTDSVVSYQWKGRQVLLPGDEVLVEQPLELSFSYRISGYLLGGV